jgi:hypothetical protein
VAGSNRIRARIQAMTDGLGVYLGVAGVLIVFALFSFLLLIQSPHDTLLWTGTKVVGSERDGLVYYSWQGQTYTLDVPGFGNAAHVDVYLKPSDPTDGERNSVLTRVTDIGFTIVPAGLGLAVVGLGAYRRRSRRRAEPAADQFGTGLDPDFVRRQLEQLRRPPRGG